MTTDPRPSTRHAGKLYITDRTSRTLLAVDPVAKSIVGTTALASGPDYVRFVAAKNELWVTEPSAGQIEIFKLDTSGIPEHDGTISVENGPESLVIDGRRGRAYARCDG